MVCHRCGQQVIDIDRVLRWVRFWDERDSWLEAREFHIWCWVRWKRRPEELGGA